MSSSTSSTWTAPQPNPPLATSRPGIPGRATEPVGPGAVSSRSPGSRPPFRRQGHDHAGSAGASVPAMPTGTCKQPRSCRSRRAGADRWRVAGGGAGSASPAHDCLARTRRRAARIPRMSCVAAGCVIRAASAAIGRSTPAHLLGMASWWRAAVIPLRPRCRQDYCQLVAPDRTRAHGVPAPHSVTAGTPCHGREPVAREHHPPALGPWISSIATGVTCIHMRKRSVEPCRSAASTANRTR
jgi:hypothetical protein